MRRGEILELPFRHNSKRALGFEIFKLSELYARADVQPTLLTPKRLDFHIIYVGIRGSGTIMIDFTPTPLGAGRFVVVARGRIQRFVPDPAVDAWMMLVAPEFLTLDPRSLDPLRGARVMSPTWLVPSLELPPADRRALLVQTAQIADEHARAEDAIQPALLAALLRAVLLRVERILRADNRPSPPAELERFFTILERDCLTTRAVAHYAKEAGISARRLGELVNEHTGRSTKQLVDERVVLEHKRMLAHTDISVKELAERTGFAEPTNLVKFFRHHTGTTPQAFRSTFSPSRRRS
jgi:AraC-like DNA-binding protein